MSSSDTRSDRRAATLIGVLFIVGTVAGALSLVVTDPLLRGPDYLARIAANPGQMIVGVLLLMTMGFALALVPVLFWPIGRRHSEPLAMGYIVFRGALETVTYVAGAFGWLLLVKLSTQTEAAGTTAGNVRVAETILWDQVIAIPFVLGALMFYGLLYQARLVPRWISAWGLVGGVLYVGAPLAAMSNLDLGFLMAPLAVQEMVMALWLIARGFNASVPEASRRAGKMAAQAIGA